MWDLILLMVSLLFLTFSSFPITGAAFAYSTVSSLQGSALGVNFIKSWDLGAGGHHCELGAELMYTLDDGVDTGEPKEDHEEGRG